MLIGNQCGAHTFPYIEVQTTPPKSNTRHPRRKIGEDQIFYSQVTRMSTGARHLHDSWPGSARKSSKTAMEFALEAQTSTCCGHHLQKRLQGCGWSPDGLDI